MKMNTTPVVSVIVPIYNVERFLDRCILSLIHQNLRNIEIILVDDGSPDNCPQICDKYALQDNRIKVIHKKNAGLGKARNSGLEVATGEYVAFVDSDDYVSVEMYEQLYSYSKRGDYDAVYCGMNIEVQNNKWEKSKEVTHEQHWQELEVKEFMLNMIASAPRVRKERLYSMSVWHAIYRRSLLEQNFILFESEREVVSEDIPFQVDFLSVAKTVAYLPEAYYYHCLNRASLSFEFKREKFIRYKTLRDKLQKKLTGVEGAIERVNRLFVGYTRNYLVCLSVTKNVEKKSILKQVLADDVWKELRKEYPSRLLPLYSRIHYELLLRKCSLFLMFYSYLLSILKHSYK